MFQLKTSCNVIRSFHEVGSYTISVLVTLGVLYTHEGRDHISPFSVIVRVTLQPPQKPKLGGVVSWELTRNHATEFGNGCPDIGNHLF